MRTILFAVALLAACGGSQPDKPFLANAPRPDPGAVAGVAAAAAAAAVLANPNAAQTPEKRDPLAGKQPVEVKEHVTGDVLDRLDQGSAAGSGSAAQSSTASDTSAAHPTKTPAKKTKGKPAKIPSPQDAAAHVGPANDDPDAVPAR